MLQQTRAQTVIPYYERFLERFPDATALAEAREADVLACWSGLGYYSRARNLQRAAKVISGKGGFPESYDAIRELPGVGPYTAAAVASIAFQAPHAVLDGNVMRVISRLYADGADIGSGKTRARFQQIADELLDRRRPGQFNQAVMELGATVCLPRVPQCHACPVSGFCEARKSNRQQELPVKRGKPAVCRIELSVAIVAKNGRVLLRRRRADEARMASFWELPSPEELTEWRATGTIGSFRHTITHHLYTVTVVAGCAETSPNGFRFQPLTALYGIPLTTISRKALQIFNRHKRSDL